MTRLPVVVTFSALLVLVGATRFAQAKIDPAALIPVVAFQPTESNSDLLDPTNWSPDTPAPPVAAVLNLTVVQRNSDVCSESNGTRVLVHDVFKSFCVQGWPICSSDHRQGLCPHSQQDLPNGSLCTVLPSNNTAHGCLANVAPTPPISCHLRSSKPRWDDSTSMNLPSSPKEALSGLPQLLLERSEHDDDLDGNGPTSARLNTPASVRKAAAASVRWQWKFWKKSSPSSPKLPKQRKTLPPGVVLTPLSRSPSPGQCNLGGLEKLNDFIDEIEEREAARLSPTRPRSAETIEPGIIGSPLPPLQMQILQRPRLFLNLNGSPTFSPEQLVRLQEFNEPSPPLNALQLSVIPKKCLNGDEVALMPCHSLQHRGFAFLPAEHWREPVRDRDKHWTKDELPSLLRGGALSLHMTPWSMTKAPGANNRGKWARYEACRFHIPKRENSTSYENLGSLTTLAKRPPRVLLRAQGTLISRSYCVVSIFGEGIFGRLYGAGLTEKRIKRCLHVEAYEPSTSRTYLLSVTLQDIEWVFRVGGDDPERESLLAPGRKQELLHQLIALLYFEYPDEEKIGFNTYRSPNDDSFSAEVVKQRKSGLPVLRISPEAQLNEAALRRLEREERLRQEEARRLENLAALLAKPRRERHRVLCQALKLRGRCFYVSVYHFPAQARNFVITAYNPGSSMTYKLTVGLLEAASLVKLYPYPRSGFSPEQTLTVARGVLPRLRLHGREDHRSNARMMLAINGGRRGPGMNALPPLDPVMTEEHKRDELFNKMLRDSQRSLQLELAITELRLHNDAEAERLDIRQKIAKLEAKRTEIIEKDQAQKTRIEEIDATGGGGANIDVKRLQEERRALKTARHTLKAEMKVTAAQIAELNLQLQGVSEKEKISSERARRRTDRQRKRLREEVLQTVSTAMQSTVPLKRRVSAGQRTWLSKAQIQPGRTLLYSGGCQISGKLVRCSLFALETETNDAPDEVDADKKLFSLELYDPSTCVMCTNFLFSKLEWLALTKHYHEKQQSVPELAPQTSEVAKRLVELRTILNDTRLALYTTRSTVSSTSSKRKAPRTSTSSSKNKNEELHRLMVESSGEIYRLNRDAPWSTLVKALCDRCTIDLTADKTGFEVTLDRCIFRAVSPVLRISSDENEDDDGESGAVYCRVHAEVLPLAEAVVFNVWDPCEKMLWRIEYPESLELLREFAVETFIEQQMHLEAITMSLLLHPNAETGLLELRFEE
ncbi:unnamed protein product [Phytophthora lilii]|uniref:Unnamed protein product n=1 Tax=Phytophthora lilii TaxID=2077276 RepID=A0A9W6X3R8_9STRA|nr:unnamed protein product [Phytophthora lilii]